MSVEKFDFYAIHLIKYERKDMKQPCAAKKMRKVWKEFKQGKLHAGSKKGPVVSKKKQALAISLSEARTACQRKK